MAVSTVARAMPMTPGWSEASAPGAEGPGFRPPRVIGLCVAITLQRWACLFPRPGTRDRCDVLGAYESIRAEASLGSPAGRDGVALADAQKVRSHEAVADCLSSTTLWLSVGSPRILRGRASPPHAAGSGPQATLTA